MLFTLGPAAAEDTPRPKSKEVTTTILFPSVTAKPDPLPAAMFTFDPTEGATVGVGITLKGPKVTATPPTTKIHVCDLHLDTGCKDIDLHRPTVVFDKLVAEILRQSHDPHILQRNQRFLPQGSQNQSKYRENHPWQRLPDRDLSDNDFAGCDDTPDHRHRNRWQLVPDNDLE
ncbi:hypothetical protein PspLS_01554 [Pyricularia sp. CBS 133598]|nr:hypothetical protein PspLS_01554 [Pyricularia sp. CBS 133598]